MNTSTAFTPSPAFIAQNEFEGLAQDLASAWDFRFYGVAEGDLVRRRAAVSNYTTAIDPENMDLLKRYRKDVTVNCSFNELANVIRTTSWKKFNKTYLSN